jgi:hypothetical protein
MKKTFVLAVSFILATGTSAVNAQLSNYTVTAPNLTENTTVQNNNNATPGVGSTVTENFSKAFPGVANVIWTKTDEATWAYFRQNGMPVRISYNEEGKLLYTIRYYTKSQVSTILKNTIEKEGYTLPIVNVTEIKSRYNTFNIVVMEDKFSILKLKVGANGDVSVCEELKKG